MVKVMVEYEIEICDICQNRDEGAWKCKHCGKYVCDKHRKEIEVASLGFSLTRTVCLYCYDKLKYKSEKYDNFKMVAEAAIKELFNKSKILSKELEKLIETKDD